jgi:type IV fimbrial biogenesis protein FimT
LAVTIAIVGILATIALPSFLNLILSSRISGQVNDIVASINLGRSEAVKRANGVTVCPSSNGTSCSGSDFGAGWIVFNDPNVDAAVNAGEEVIRAYPAPTGGTQAKFSGTTTSLTFLQTGRPLATFSGSSVKVHAPSDTAGTYDRYICINSQGRPRVDTPAQKATDAICGN